jgi:hypothetical protein
MVGGCADAGVSRESGTPVPVVVEPAPEPTPAPLPYDESFDTEEKRAAWADAVSKAIGAYAALPDPKKIEAEYAAKFKVTPKGVASRIGDTSVWRADYVREWEDERGQVVKGDARSIVTHVNGEYSQWRAGAWKNRTLDRVDFGKEPDVPSLAAVVLAAKSDRKRALEIAGDYLKDPFTNVVAWAECAEGCNTIQIRGTMELFHLVKSDPVLKAAYLARVRQWGAVAFPNPVVWDESKLGALMLLVRGAKDAELTRAYAEALRSQGNGNKGTVAFLRVALGLSGAIDKLDSLQYGDMPVADMKALWNKFGLIVGEAGYPSDLRDQLVREIRRSVEDAENRRFEQGIAVLDLLMGPDRARRANDSADRSRTGMLGENASREVFPRNAEQANEMIAPHLASLEAAYPAGYVLLLAGIGG